jgi:hypothetical protein
MKRYDVAVCGGGPSGVSAAVAAARAGAKTALVERYGFCGGMATSALVNPWIGHRWSDPETRRPGSLTGGFFREVVSRQAEQGAYRAKISSAAFDEQRLKYIYDCFLREAGVDCLLHTLVIGAETSGGRIESAELVSKSGRERLGADVFIDATGDGDLAALAGCAHEVGRKADGLTQAMTLSFRVAGIDKEALLDDGHQKGARALVEPYFQEAREAGRLEYPYRDFVQFYDYPRPGVLHFNMTRINRVSGLSREDLSHAEMEGRRQAVVLTDWLVREVPWFKNAWLEKLACQVGVRETRHIAGEYTITQEDIAEGRKFGDGIARSAYFIDIHSPTGPGFDHEIKGTAGKAKASFRPPPGEYYEIPYRALVPKDAENLLVPCRALSASHEGCAAVRVMANMTATGEAAGLAAAEAAARKKAVGEIDGAAIRRRLEYLDQPPELGGLWE